MGRRKISFEPAASIFGLLGLMVIKVSLWGPHSFETSTLPETTADVVLSGLASPPLSRMNSYLLHQVGSCELFCAFTLGAGVEIPRLNATNTKATKIDRCTLFFIKLSFVGLRKQLRPSEPCLPGAWILSQLT